MANPYPLVRRPIPGHRAFATQTPEALLSQSALLLFLGQKLRGAQRRLDTRAHAAATRGVPQILPARESRDFPLPEVALSAAIVEVQALRENARKLGADLWGRRGAAAAPGDFVQAYDKLAKRLYEKPTVQNTLTLFEACLEHPQALPRVAAAAAHFPHSTTPRRLTEILGEGARSEDALVRDLAATALARYVPRHDALKPLLQRASPNAGGAPSNTSLLVHGTWARRDTWWQPGGEFHTFARTQVRTDLYNQPDRFDWSGGYSDGARRRGAQDLKDWVAAREPAGLAQSMAHSHGANVSMLATQFGAKIDELVLLSCPVHPEYTPNFSNSARVISIRVRADIVIALDGGGQEFGDARIEENVLDCWFNHSLTRDPDTWRRFGLKSRVTNVP